MARTLKFMSRGEGFYGTFYSATESYPTSTCSLTGLVISRPGRVPRGVISYCSSPRSRKSNDRPTSRRRVIGRFFGRPKRRHTGHVHVGCVHGLLHFSGFCATGSRVFGVLSRLSSSGPTCTILTNPLFRSRFFSGCHVTVTHCSFHHRFPSLIRIVLRNMPYSALRVRFVGK